MFELVFITQESCPPCKKFEPTFLAVKNELKTETKFVIEQASKSRFRVTSTPTVILAKDGKPELIWKGTPSRLDLETAAKDPIKFLEKYK
jgi:thiol-disulfide isomerase/thioredoxin